MRELVTKPTDTATHREGAHEGKRRGKTDQQKPQLPPKQRDIGLGRNCGFTKTCLVGKRMNCQQVSYTSTCDMTKMDEKFPQVSLKPSTGVMLYPIDWVVHPLLKVTGKLKQGSRQPAMAYVCHALR